MGREMRMVPPNWVHPYAGEKVLRPMYDETFENAASAWRAGYAEWQAGSAAQRLMEYWEYNRPPERENYRPWLDAEATWCQVWETVSYGTPVTPPFATASELIEYLVANGDMWDQRRRRKGSTMPCGPWPRRDAESLVLGGLSSPTLVVHGGAIDRGISMGNGGPH